MHQISRNGQETSILILIHSTVPIDFHHVAFQREFRNFQNNYPHFALKRKRKKEKFKAIKTREII